MSLRARKSNQFVKFYRITLKLDVFSSTLSVNVEIFYVNLSSSCFQPSRVAPVPHHRHEVPWASWAGGPRDCPLLRGAEGHRDPPAPQTLPVSGDGAGRDQASQDGQLLSIGTSLHRLLKYSVVFYNFSVHKWIKDNYLNHFLWLICISWHNCFVCIGTLKWKSEWHIYKCLHDVTKLLINSYFRWGCRSSVGPSWFIWFLAHFLKIASPCMTWASTVFAGRPWRSCTWEPHYQWHKVQKYKLLLEYHYYF